MSARGVRIDFGDGGSAEYLRILGLTGSDRFDLANEDFTICGWMRALGALSAQTDPSHRGFWLFVLEDQITFLGASLYLEGTDAFPGTALNASGQTESMPAAHNNFADGASAIDQDEDWFYALVWDHTAGSWTRYVGLDESGSLASASVGSLNYTAATPIRDIAIGADFANNYGINADVTNVKIWKRAFTSGELLDEMTSEDPVIDTGIWGHYKFEDHLDLSNVSAGVGPSWSVVGTLGDGTMDPVDLQAAAPAVAGRVVIIS